jgi:hypothetical protein
VELAEPDVKVAGCGSKVLIVGSSFMTLNWKVNPLQSDPPCTFAWTDVPSWAEVDDQDADNDEVAQLKKPGQLSLGVTMVQESSGSVSQTSPAPSPSLSD